MKRKPLNHIAVIIAGILLAAATCLFTTNANAQEVKYECGPGTKIPICPPAVQIVNDEDNSVEYECGPGTKVPQCPRRIVVTEKAPPPAEICDGQDNDRDGWADEGRNICPAGYTCQGRFGCLPNIPDAPAPAPAAITPDDRSTLDHWSQFHFGFNTALALTGGSGEVDGRQVSPQVGALIQFRPGKSWFGIELGLNVGRSYRTDDNGGDTTDLSENLLALFNLNDNWIILAGYKAEHGADLDFQATRVHLGELGVRYAFGNGDHYAIGAAGLLGYGVQAVEVQSTMIGQPMGEPEIEHREGLRYGGLLQFVWTP